MTDVRLGTPIDYGRTAEIYPWGTGKVLKLYRLGWGVAEAAHEARIARALQMSGLPVPAVGDCIEVDGRAGLIFERVDGPSLWEPSLRKPWTLFWAVPRLLADLHASVHRVTIPTLPSQRERFAHRIGSSRALDPSVKERLLRILDTLPDGDVACHGDFHLGNVIIAAQGPVIIDWVDATRGNPLADVARTLVLSAVAGLHLDITGRIALAAARPIFVHGYLARYFALSAPGDGGPHHGREDRAQLHRWVPLVAAARLSERAARIVRI